MRGRFAESLKSVLRERARDINIDESRSTPRRFFILISSSCRTKRLMRRHSSRRDGGHGVTRGEARGARAGARPRAGADPRVLPPRRRAAGLRSGTCPSRCTESDGASVARNAASNPPPRAHRPFAPDPPRRRRARAFPLDLRQDDLVNFKVNSLTSDKTALPVEYYKLPFASPHASGAARRTSARCLTATASSTRCTRCRRGWTRTARWSVEVRRSRRHRR